MKVTVRKTGGIMGLDEIVGTRTIRGRTDEVDRRVSSILRDVSFFELPEHASPSGVFDAFTFTVLVEDDDRTHRVSFDAHSPDPFVSRLHELIAVLEDHTNERREPMKALFERLRHRFPGGKHSSP